MKYAVIKQWHDNPNDFAVIEYFETIDECNNYIKKQKKDPRYEWGVASY